MLFLLSTNKRETTQLIKQKFYEVKIRWMPKGSAPIIKAIDPQKALYVPAKNFIGFRQSVNIQNQILDKTTNHTMYIETEISPTNNQNVIVQQNPISHQFLEKPLLNSHQISSKMPPVGTKSSMLVNPHKIEVPYTVFQKYNTGLKNLPENSNPKVGRSVETIRKGITNGTIDLNMPQEKRVLDLHNVENFSNKHSGAHVVLSDLISARFLTSTCNVLEMQYHHLIENHNNPAEIKAVVSDMADTLQKETTKVNEYTVPEMNAIVKCYNGICTFKSTL